MSVIAAALKHMLASGMPHDAIVQAVADMEAASASGDVQADRRRERDRIRKRAVRGNPQTSADSAETADNADIPLPLPSSPQTPQQPTPSPMGISTREAAKRDDRAEALAFGEFWTAYPRKVAKPEAAKAYAKALRRVDAPDAAATVLAGLARHLPAWAETEPDLVPHPTTWLNQDRFHDTPSAPRTPQPRLAHDRGPRQSPGSDKLHAVAGAMRAAFGPG